MSAALSVSSLVGGVWPQRLRTADEPFLTPRERSALDAGHWFSSLAPALRHDIFCSSVVRRFERGEPIYPVPEVPHTLDAVTAGCARIHSSASLPHGRIISLVAPGTWFMDPAMFTDGLRVHSVHAHRETTLLSIPHRCLERIVQEHPAFSMRLFTLQQSHAARLFSIVHELLTLSMRDRIAKTLARLGAEHASRDQEGCTRLGSLISQGELAAMVGASRQRVNLELKYFERSGYLRNTLHMTL